MVVDQAVRLLDLQPQDRVVTVESEREHDWEPVECVYYVDTVDYGVGIVYALTPYGHSHAIPFADIVDIQKARDPIRVPLPADTARIIGCAELAGQRVRVVALGVFEGRINSLCVRRPQHHEPKGWLHLERQAVSLRRDSGRITDTDLIKRLPSSGYCVARAGDPSTARNRIIRTARGRVARYIAAATTGKSAQVPANPCL